MRILPFVFLASASGLAQNLVTINVNAAQTLGHYKLVYAYFGYDEPNYTYTANGRKLVGELAALSRDSVISAHISCWQPEMARPQ